MRRVHKGPATLVTEGKIGQIDEPYRRIGNFWKRRAVEWLAKIDLRGSMRGSGQGYSLLSG